MLIENFKKDTNNPLKEIQENTGKLVEHLKEETQNFLKELQENTGKQRLTYLGIHPINSHQTMTLGQEVNTKRSMPWLSLEGPFQSLTNTDAEASNQLLDWARGSAMEVLEGVPEELKGFTAPWEEH